MTTAAQIIAIGTAMVRLVEGIDNLERLVKGAGLTADVDTLRGSCSTVYTQLSDAIEVAPLTAP